VVQIKKTTWDSTLIGKVTREQDGFEKVITAKKFIDISA